MKITFITTNKHKFQEASEILKDFSIDLVWLDAEYEENHDASIEEIANNAAKKLANKLDKPIIVEDTGLFFAAYNSFPGAFPKFVFKGIGYQGIFRLLDRKSRNAYFKTVLAFCKPNQEPILFDGIKRGKIAREIYNKKKDVMPYDRIFIPENKQSVISNLTISEKNAISQRGEVFRKLGKYIKSCS